MPKNLVIVESPAKAKTIAKFLGGDYEIKSSYGHIRDLPKKGLGVDVAKNFEPTYEVDGDKKKIVAELKKAAKNKTVWLASDEDREGEAIAWHVCNILGLDPAKTNRIVFHEITKPAILEAVKNPRNIDMQLVDAQQARRVLDRLVGYELSPVLWKKVRAGLSAGRVQSVAVRLIVEREREIKNFKPEVNYKVTAQFKADKDEIPAELNQRLDRLEDAKKFFSDVKDAKFTVSAIEQKPGTRNPSPPFTTSTLQQEAARRLGYSVRQTMTLAQRLYDNGHITYMRTDSVNLSPLATTAAQAYIKKIWGYKYLQTRAYKTKSRSAQEAHEAIRPTDISKTSAGNDAQQQKLYELIWQRMVASQMAAANIEKTEIKIVTDSAAQYFTASGEVLVFDGFLKVYGGGKEDVILPALRAGQTLELISLNARETFSKPQARYSEASLVKKLEALGIGRPSTYAPTISTIQDRGYVEKKDLEGEQKNVKSLALINGEVKENEETVTVGADRSKLIPTDLADIVTDFLVQHFGDIVDDKFTARAEEEFDDVADGKITWQKALNDFYKRFHPLVEKSENVSRAEAAKLRVLGKDPASGQSVIARFGRYGPVLQLVNEDEKGDKSAPAKFAPLPAGATLENVTLEQALPMFDLPRVVGKTDDGQEITANVGRFGPYVKAGKQFVSIKGQDPLTITEAEARELIKEKAKAAAERTVADFGKIKILRGPYGPYITDDKKNARIPKDQDPAEITEPEAIKMLEAAPARTWRRRSKR